MDEFDAIQFDRLLARRDPLILEIGANNGAHTNRFLSLFPKATIHAFEPDPRAASQFRQTVLSERAQLHTIAIGDRDGTAEFHASNGSPPPEVTTDVFPEGWHMSGSIRRPKAHFDEHPWVTFEESFGVSLRKLDGWCQDNAIEHEIDLIWADVQGAEVDLIRGAQESLGRTRYFYTEYNDKELYEGQIGLDGILELLPQFRIERQFEDDVLLRNVSLPPRSAWRKLRDTAASLLRRR